MCLRPCVYVSVRQCVRASMCLCVNASVCLCVNASVRLCVCVSVCLCVCVSASVCLCFCASVCLCVCVSVRLSVWVVSFRHGWPVVQSQPASRPLLPHMNKTMKRCPKKLVKNGRGKHTWAHLQVADDIVMAANVVPRHREVTWVHHVHQHQLLVLCQLNLCFQTTEDLGALRVVSKASIFCGVATTENTSAYLFQSGIPALGVRVHGAKHPFERKIQHQLPARENQQLLKQFWVHSD
jgi:hypothetical protein